MAYLLQLAILPVLIAIVRSDYTIGYAEVSPYSGDTQYRLPELLDPVHYDVEITPYFTATELREAFTFDGIVSITVTALEENITELTLHENVPLISGITVTDQTGTIIPLNETRPFELLKDYQFLKIYLRNGVTLVKDESYVIRIEYLGRMNETPLSRGVFRGSYIGSDGIRHWYAATHLQPTHSRQAFPSFDEPGFKSTFTIIINRPANFTETFSNMPLNQSIPSGDRVKEIFKTTPRMSAYLVTFHISEEFEVIADNNNSERSYRILARPNARGQGAYALEVGPPLTEWLEDYFGIPYYTMGDEMKNDQIASPDWASGATENWGLVSYRELRLLYEEGETNSLDKMYIGTITAHELAHKWFGNLVTCRWWDNVWINEGYASYFEYFAMDAVDPSMELADQFNIMYLQSALSVDSGASTRALQHTVNSPDEVTGHFSGISYSKGASLLMMLKHFLTEATFKKALQYYLVNMSYEHAFPEDVFRNFEVAVEEDGVLNDFPNVNISNFLDYWVNEQGYPVLDVQVNMETGVMSLSQERFFLDPSQSADPQAWPLPLTFTTQSNPNWDDVRATHVMTGSTYEITKNPGEEWVIFNVKQNGIYRVNYDTYTWELLASALKHNPSSIHYLNRAQIVDDVFALMRSERISYALGFKVLDFLKEETNYYVWYPAVTGLNALRNRLLHLPSILSQFDEILYEFLDGVITDLGYDQGATDSLTRSLNRFFVMAFACNIGHPGCVTDAIQKFNAFVNNGVSVSPDLRRHVYCSGLRNSGYDEWRWLHDRFLNANNQASEIVLLRALGCTTDDAAVQEYLELILSDNVRAQNRVDAFTFLYIGDRSNVRRALDFIKEKYNDIREGVVGAVRLRSVLSNIAAYMDEETLQEYETWLLENQEALPEYTSGIAGITSTRNIMEWGTQRANEILSAARGSANVILPTTVLLVGSLLTLLLK